MFAEKSAQQCLFLKAFGCDGVMVKQVALLMHGQNIGTRKTTSAFTIFYPMITFGCNLSSRKALSSPHGKRNGES